MDINTLATLREKGYNSRASIDSFNQAVEAAYAQKMGQPSPTTHQTQQPPIVRQTVTTTQTQPETQGLDTQTAADLQEVSVQENEELERPAEQEAIGDIAE
jgi:hypothetical protein